MLFRRFKWDVMTLSFGGLSLLLLAAAIFMHRAVNRASAGEQRERHEQLEAALFETVKDFSAALREVPDLRGETKTPAQLDGWIGEQYHRWRSKTAQPEIIRAVNVGKLTTNKQAAFAQLALTEEKVAFRQAEWPEALVALRNDLLTRAQNKALRPMMPDAIAQFQNSNQFFIVLPLTSSVKPPAPPQFTPPARKLTPPPIARPFPGPPRGEGRNPGGRPGGPPPSGFPPPDGPPGGFPGGRPGGPPPFARQRWQEMEERQKRLEAEMQKERRAVDRRIQEMQEMHDARPPMEQLAGYCVLELDGDYLQTQLLPGLIAQHFRGAELAQYRVAAVIEPSQQTFFATEAKASLTAPDAEEILFQGDAKAWREAAPPSPNTLVLRAQHKAGSLQSVIQRTRQRNLALGYGVLLLLFAAASALLIATQRARALAQRQMEFVAGVTHELRTPLTAIQSAGFNLSSGRVNDAERVKQYGAMIHTEGRRLADLIDQVVSYARIETNRKAGEHSYNFQPLEVSGVIEQAFREYEAAFANWHVEKHIAANLPPVQADANVLTSAVKNLLQNALKYAAQGQWLRIAATRVNSEVQITVADHGPGIERRDLPHIFAPFYRAQKMVASAVPGTGLGLSLVNEYMKAHHGRVTVDSAVSKGTTFTLHLPIHGREMRPANNH